MQVDDNTLRSLWKAAGGSTEGIDVPIAILSEAKLFAFLREIIRSQSTPSPEFPTVERAPAPNNYLIAAAIDVSLCDNCNMVHVSLHSGDGKMFAGAALASDLAGAFARDILDAARSAKDRNQ